jgi:N-acetylglutamate synthase-like GNAT family acetyltransferase
VGDEERAKVVVRSHLEDRRAEPYTVREAIGAEEIGRIQRMFLQFGLPLSFRPHQRYLVMMDREDRIVGGLCYRLIEPTVAQLAGTARAPALKGRGLSELLLEDFCSRMVTQGVKVVCTHFVSKEFFLANGFRVDHRWGGLVRFLDETPPRDLHR